MSHILELTDEQYATLQQVAARSHETPQQLVERLVNALASTHGPIFYTDDDLLRALGADDEEIAELAKLEWPPDADE